MGITGVHGMLTETGCGPMVVNLGAGGQADKELAKQI